jgi:hypothetical protein
MAMFFSTRCVFRWIGHEGQPYEERITLWQAQSLDEAIALGEKEAVRYAKEWGYEYAGFCQAFEILGEEVSSGAEVFSLLRDSDLTPEEYVSRFFDTGKERQS